MFYTILIMLCSLIIACNSRITRIDSWYNTAVPFNLPEISLKGKSIMLDPGHGNANGGAYGRGGTIERDVNLQVAIYLKRMLEDKGATVYMLREDVNSSWWNDSMGYVGDLAMRCRIRDSLQPDLFLSLHHNGTADGNKLKNIPKVFYPVTDPGASLDIAQYINKAFTELLGLGTSELYCANYYVLRDPSVPTVLGEASYLSNPEMERMLNDTNVLKYEATTYFDGICKWVEGGLVSIRSFTFDTSKGLLTIEITSDSAIDPLLTHVDFKGNKLPGILQGNMYTVRVPDNIPNGKQQFTVVAMNHNGRSSMKKAIQVTINRIPADMKIISNSRENGQIVKITAMVLDDRGCEVIDSTKVVYNNDTAFTKDGEALFYLQKKDVTDSIAFSCMSIIKKVKIEFAQGSIQAIQGFVYADDNATPVAHSSIKTDSLVTFTDRFGFFSLSATDAYKNYNLLITANGYRDTLIQSNAGIVNNIVLTPVASGVLIGKRIVIDPEFGGIETGGINKHGIRASDKNRSVALNLAAILERHGADVIMARNDDRTVTLTERLEIAEKLDAQCYIIIRTDSMNTDPRITICQRSTHGRQIAEAMKFHWKEITRETVPIREEISFILQQTRCPAIQLS
ncbi:MAG TPA: N-acetylmuramoyl-L-alanine amidase, partial [Chitinispirillaceae bacterium]|nr:N-acetylmuramoyl-L-alanine amidase [Chitinispirillaceae bacterium]